MTTTATHTTVKRAPAGFEDHYHLCPDWCRLEYDRHDVNLQHGRAVVDHDGPDFGAFISAGGMTKAETRRTAGVRRHRSRARLRNDGAGAAPRSGSGCLGGGRMAGGPAMSTMAAIRVVCPSWCEVTEAEHAEELRDPFMAGDVTHHKSASMVSVRHTTRPDGTTYPDEPKPGILIDAEADIEGAELLVS